MELKIEYEQWPPVEGTMADVSSQGEEIGTMVYCSDLDQWNSCLNPGEVSDTDPNECAIKMVRYYTEDELEEQIFEDLGLHEGLDY